MYIKKYIRIFIISILLILTHGFLLYADDNNSYKVIKAKNDTEFAIQTSKLKNENNKYKSISASTNKNRLLVVYNNDFNYHDFDGLDTIIFNKNNLCVMQFNSNINADNAYKKLKKDKNIKSVEFDSIIKIINNFSSIGATTIKHKSWGADAIEIDKYIKYIKKIPHKKIIISVVDTGIYYNHSFLKSRIDDSGYDFVSTDEDPDDENGHGTHVAGIIVDCTYNFNDIKIMPIRVLDEDGHGWMSDLVSGILYSADNGASVINLSLCGPHSEYIDSSIKNIIKKGSIVVCAAGNENINIDTNEVCPAHIKNAITVGAINDDLIVTYYSNYGKSLDVVAPGDRINSCSLDGKYIINSGTSMAAPHVSACAALLKMRYPNKSCTQIGSVIRRSADSDTPKKYYGSGMIDMENLLDSIKYQNIKVKKKFTYTGKVIKPIITVSQNGEKLFKGEDYTVSYKNNKKIGTASVIIKGKGSYSGSRTLYFKIVPKGTEIKSIKANKKEFIVKWKKQKSKISGYQIQYSTNKNFKNSKKKTIKNKDIVSYKISNLKSKKIYYVQIRTYKIVDNKKYYSFWSDIKSIKIR